MAPWLILTLIIFVVLMWLTVLYAMRERVCRPVDVFCCGNQLLYGLGNPDTICTELQEKSLNSQSEDTVHLVPRIILGLRTPIALYRALVVYRALDGGGYVPRTELYLVHDYSTEFTAPVMALSVVTLMAVLLEKKSGVRSRSTTPSWG
ncbi:hypothetical protein GMRT_20545 [Giardia muris]|uniref:Uncharacterized protein n=1 Tax=Giardia muris TaxID=5742 RepID=A0A4Z1SVD6_GIAMU|nr:hypothetical protein GMRT_20545 [Giardia muris]|eukprot:TNJ29744.1 hypothetical protein GMRT_20545 [Giardia muris]